MERRASDKGWRISSRQVRIENMRLQLGPKGAEGATLHPAEMQRSAVVSSEPLRAGTMHSLFPAVSELKRKPNTNPQ